MSVRTAEIKVVNVKTRMALGDVALAIDVLFEESKGAASSPPAASSFLSSAGGGAAEGVCGCCSDDSGAVEAPAILSSVYNRLKY